MSVITELQQTVWMLPEALSVVRALQPVVRRFGYHIALGGGVLNKGYSKKDLDLYFLPMAEAQQNPDGVIGILREMFGTEEEILSYGENEMAKLWIKKVKFVNNEKRVDAFVAASIDWKPAPFEWDS